MRYLLYASAVRSLMAKQPNGATARTMFLPLHRRLSTSTLTERSCKEPRVTSPGEFSTFRNKIGDLNRTGTEPVLCYDRNNYSRPESVKALAKCIPPVGSSADLCSDQVCISLRLIPPRSQEAGRDEFVDIPWGRAYLWECASVPENKFGAGSSGDFTTANMNIRERGVVATGPSTGRTHISMGESTNPSLQSSGVRRRRCVRPEKTMKFLNHTCMFQVHGNRIKLYAVRLFNSKTGRSYA